MSLDLKSSKNFLLPTPEDIKDEEVKSVFKKLMSSQEGDRNKIFEDVKTLFDILAGTKAMQNIFNMGSNLINNVTDPVSNQDAATKKYVDDSVAGSGDMSYGDTRFKVGSFTRDTSLASGTQAITGVGFIPKAVIFICLQSTTKEAGWGFDDIITAVGFGRDATADLFLPEAASSIVNDESSTLYYLGKILSFDSDGFTITWTRGSTPTGTLTVQYLAYR